MSTATTSTAATEAADTSAGDGSWHPVTRVAFRFVFVYFGLFCLLFAQITFVLTGVIGQWLPDHAVLWQLLTLRPLLSWVGRQAFDIEATLHADSGSGDQAAIWVMVFSLAVLAAVVTLIWTVLDRRRTDYTRLHAWFLVFVRLCLGGQMLFYGMAKLIPTQMPEPPLSALLQQFGELSPASVLWLQVGSSHPYEMLLGGAEVLGGLLLFLPRTATLGALVSLVSMVQVFVLNMTFDVPVKILSFHLLLLAAVLLAPQIGRLADVFFFARPAQLATQPQLFDTPRANRTAAAIQVAIGVWVLAGTALASWTAWHEYGGGAPAPDLYGIWAVTDFQRDGAAAPPLTTDGNRWQRIVFDSSGAVTLQNMDGSLLPVDADVDDDARTIVLIGPDAPVGTFTFERSAPDRLALDGTVPVLR